ncbi:MAG: VOC family protein [Bacteroidetes bacterium]|nr:VOC family protein [Bacteroidota bacterium]MBL0014856.1 VOC family protein [Bacteroidota bacterium]MBP6639957.1 VOC family protein [Bacteroidia bacterium]MBP6722683.1 VOC family protein [Bacteroidia bacterium]MBP8073680.1 VOC family protein [Bacteroidia bacterium]
MSIRPFHLAFPVKDLDATRKFYTETLGCRVGRSADLWIDFDFYGHQISAHLVPENQSEKRSNPVDGKNVPVSHWGVILDWDTWHVLSERLTDLGIEFIIAPYLRFAGEPGEQATMFFQDPSGNCLEFKSFKDDSHIFRASF